ncbi:hypothetical protein BJ508DRAFT_418211 [Ascobolus immersus RN42]|uniref:Zonadhesin n=1 Tax=Ascobolus immersus RN42 TaxID=1160509 RepID=A0A3N4HNG5_ASCIM|nr:hypothetical protein BJ508DRAFT_418211 [Ascobolus immersus RN42]
MVAFKSVLLAALAATSVSAIPRFHRRQANDGVFPSIPVGGFRNTTIPAGGDATVTTPVVPIGTGAVEAPTVTETTTKEVFTTVSVTYTLGNGKVVTTSFTKVRQPTPSTTSAETVQVTHTVVPVATPEEIEEAEGKAEETPVLVEEEEPVLTTSTSTTVVYTTVTVPPATSTDFAGLDNDFITKTPSAPGAEQTVPAHDGDCLNAVTETVTETLPAVTVTVPVQVVTVTSVSVSISTVSAAPTEVPAATEPTAAPAPVETEPVEFEEVPSPTESEIDTSVPEATPLPTVTDEVPVPITTGTVPIINGTAPFFPNGTAPGNETVVTRTATLIPVAPTLTPIEESDY